MIPCQEFTEHIKIIQAQVSVTNQCSLSISTVVVQVPNAYGTKNAHLRMCIKNCSSKNKPLENPSSTYLFNPDLCDNL